MWDIQLICVCKHFVKFQVSRIWVGFIDWLMFNANFSSISAISSLRGKISDNGSVINYYAVKYIAPFELSDEKIQSTSIEFNDTCS